nr:glycosyltransferase family 1 protein [Halomonas socia]
MRLCLVSETWAPDINGVAHTLGQLTDELRRRGVTLQLVRPAPREAHRDSRMASELQVPGFHLPRYPDVQFGRPCARRLLGEWQIDPPDAIYLATEGPLGWSALRSAERLGIPTLSGFHTNFDHYASDYGLGWLRGGVLGLLRHFHNRTGATLVPTRQQAEALGAQGFERVAVMGRGIDCQHFSPDKRDSELRRCWGAGNHQPVALHVGRLASEKNLDLLVESFQAMHLAQPDLVSVVVGDGPLRQRLQRRLPQTRFTGFIDSDQLARHYASADLFVFPSRSETYGNVVLEAMASGLAVIAFDYAAAAEWIVPHHHGLTLPLDASSAFVEHAAQLARSPALYGRLGRAARVRVADCHWSQIAERFLHVLHTAMEHAHDRTTHPAGL